MALSIRDKAQAVATFRFVKVYLMESLARWVPTTPEMEVKVLFGRHIWDVAQHADALGRRTHELRAPLHFSLRPREAYLRVLEELTSAQQTAERIHGFYDVLLPGLAVRYHRYLEQTDRLLDEPTVRILERILEDEARMRKESEELRSELPQIRLAGPSWLERLAQRESDHQEIVHHASADVSKETK